MYFCQVFVKQITLSIKMQTAVTSKMYSEVCHRQRIHLANATTQLYIRIDISDIYIVISYRLSRQIIIRSYKVIFSILKFLANNKEHSNKSWHVHKMTESKALIA